MQERSDMVEVCEGECMGCSSGDEPHTLMRCHSLMKPLGGNLSVTESTTQRAKIGKFISFLFFLNFVSILELEEILVSGAEAVA